MCLQKEPVVVLSGTFPRHLPSRRSVGEFLKVLFIGAFDLSIDVGVRIATAARYLDPDPDEKHAPRDRHVSLERSPTHLRSTSLKP